MKHLLLLLFGVLFLIISCEKNTEQYNLDGIEYPPGIFVVNLISENNCNLPKCSGERVKRLNANGVRALATDDSTLQVGLTFDSVIKLRTCQKLDSSFMKTLDPDIPWVRFSGDLYDACGVFQYDWPVEENYVVRIRNIEKVKS